MEKTSKAVNVLPASRPGCGSEQLGQVKSLTTTSLHCHYFSRKQMPLHERTTRDHRWSLAGVCLCRRASYQAFQRTTEEGTRNEGSDGRKESVWIAQWRCDGDAPRRGSSLPARALWERIEETFIVIKLIDWFLLLIITPTSPFQDYTILLHFTVFATWHFVLWPFIYSLE
jgi:hypothetical protein